MCDAVQTPSASMWLAARDRQTVLINNAVQTSSARFFKVENNSLELTRIFKESFKGPKVRVRRKCKGGEER